MVDPLPTPAVTPPNWGTQLNDAIDSRFDENAAAIATKAPLASPVFTGDPQAPTAMFGDNDTSVATTAFVQAAVAAVGVGGGGNVPVGGLVMFGGSTAPAGGWLLCDGTAVSRTTYAALFAVVGTAYGVGNGTTTFNLPNFKGRGPIGLDASQTEFDTLGETGGAKQYTLSTSEIPVHSHSIDHDHPSTTSSSSGAHQHDISVAANGSVNNAVRVSGEKSSGSGLAGPATIANATASAGAHTHTTDLPNFTGVSGTTGGGVAHPILDPYQVVTFLIKT